MTSGARRVLLTRSLPQAAMDYLAGRCDLNVVDTGGPVPRHRLFAGARGAAGIIAMLTDRIDAEVLDAGGADLAVVSNYAVGYDNIDVRACAARGVIVTNTPDVLTEATADLTWCLVLAASRRLVEGDRLVRAGTPWGWSPTFMLGREVTGRTLGIVGMGRIGQAVARRARAFRMPVLYTSRERKPSVEERLAAEWRDFDGLLRETDVVTVHVPLTEETRHLFGAPEFAVMKPTAVFVNTARGAVVDEAALASALATGEIFAAGLDVYEREPEVHGALLGLPNVVLAPHLGSATVETRTAMAMLAAENCIAVLEGRPPPAPVNLDP